MIKKVNYIFLVLLLSLNVIFAFLTIANHNYYIIGLLSLSLIATLLIHNSLFNDDNKIFKNVIINLKSNLFDILSMILLSSLSVYSILKIDFRLMAFNIIFWIIILVYLYKKVFE